MDRRQTGLGDLLTVKALIAPKATPPVATDPQPFALRSALSLPSAATGNSLRGVWPRSKSKEAIFSGTLPRRGPGWSHPEDRPPLPSLGSLPRRILPRCSGSSLECDTDKVGQPEALVPEPPAEVLYVEPLRVGAPTAAAAWPAEAASLEERSTVAGPETIISLPGDAFSLAEAAESPEVEDVLSELRSVSEEEIEEADLEDDQDDEDDAVDGTEVEEDKAFETEAEGRDEGDDLDFAKDSDSDQPGTTQEDIGQCDDGLPEREGNETEGVVEELLLIDGDEPVIVVKKKKHKRKKKKKKRRKVVSEEATVEKKPPVPRFPHPTQSKDLTIRSSASLERTLSTSERVPLRERFAKHLLLGRFPKRKAVHPSDVDDAAVEADDEEKPDLGEGDTDADAGTHEDISASEDQAVSSTRGAVAHGAGTAVPRHARQRQSGASGQRRVTVRPPRVVRIKRILQKEPETRDDGEKTETDTAEAKGSPSRSFGLVAKAMPLRRDPNPPKTVWKEPVVETLLSLGSLYFSFSSMRTPEGKKVPLKNRDKVVKTLHELNTKVALPICRQFGLRYNFFSEHHPQAKKAGVTCKEPLILRKQGPDGTEVQETRYLVTIRLRLRLHPTKGDPQTDFVSHGTRIAVLLHELCHLKHMNHGKDFMLFLRDIFAFATKTLGVFEAGESNEIPSPWPWENLIFQRAGDVSDDELLKLFAEHREKQRQAKTPDPEPSQEIQEKASPAPEADIEAFSTSASDGQTTPPRPPRGEGAEGRSRGAPLSLVAAFSCKGPGDVPCDCCDPVDGSGGARLMAYGEEALDMSESAGPLGEDVPPPQVPTDGLRLPPLASSRRTPTPAQASPKPVKPQKATERLPPLVVI